jgi:hypothetical protein
MRYLLILAILAWFVVLSLSTAHAEVVVITGKVVPRACEQYLESLDRKRPANPMELERCIKRHERYDILRSKR